MWARNLADSRSKTLGRATYDEGLDCSTIPKARLVSLGTIARMTIGAPGCRLRRSEGTPAGSLPRSGSDPSVVDVLLGFVEPTPARVGPGEVHVPLGGS
jgi:hypothetical protein